VKKSLVEVLVCPVCRDSLVLHIEEEEEDRVIVGSLECNGCHDTYPIEDSIPNLLPPRMRS